MDTGKHGPLGMTAYVLLLVGGLNLGLVGLGGLLTRNLDVIGQVLGQWPKVISVLYLLIGLSALWALFGMKK